MFQKISQGHVVIVGTQAQEVETNLRTGSIFPNNWREVMAEDTWARCLGFESPWMPMVSNNKDREIELNEQKKVF